MKKLGKGGHMKPTRIGLQAGALLLLLSTFPAGAFQAPVQISPPEGVGLAGGIIRVAGEKVPEDQMPEFCRSMAVEEMRVNLEDLSTLDPIVRPTEILIQGEWDSPDDDRTAPFECRFGRDGVFQNFSR